MCVRGPSTRTAMRVTASAKHSRTLVELIQALMDGTVVGRGVSTKLAPGVEIGAHVCDVEVGTGTGLVAMLRYSAVQDWDWPSTR